ncbi:MAG TPA: (Fe-S)-binding protein, partial [Syntrophales bacterium]|nr:(Fe-S)-binding protein [Syntrophales bacterium]
CQLTESRPDYVEKTYDYLRSKLHEEVGLMLRCCGVPAEWAGRQECFLEEIHKFSMLWKNMGCPTVVTACPTCHHVLKENLSDIPIESLWEIFERTGLPPDAQRGGGHVLAIHDSCSARYETSIQDSVRRLITQLGYVIEELPLNRTKTECCGYGGLLYHINREVTQRVITDRISLSSADYVSYCSNCRDFFARYGKPSLHLFDLIFGKNMRDEAFHRGPGYSVRNDNRIRLKASLLKRLWGATETMREEFETTAVLISPQMEKKMEDQCILVEDVQRVIHHAERTGNKVFNPDNGHFMAHLRPEIITYWVEYTSEPEGYRIHNAYSHRLQIIEDEIPS